MVSVSDSLNAISNDKSLVLFNTIALASEDSSILISRFELTRKQYYSRIFKLTKAGLIRRRNGKYFLTSFGRIVYGAQELIGKAIHYSSKLKTIDSIDTPEFPVEERNKLIDTLINNSEIKEILVSRHGYNIPAENKIADNKEIIVSALTECSSLRFSPSI